MMGKSGEIRPGWGPPKLLRNKVQGEDDRATFGKSHRSGDCYVGKRKLWGTRKSDTEESVQRKVEGALGTRGEVKVRRVEDNGEGEQLGWYL